MPTRIVDYQSSLAKQSIWIKKPKIHDPEDASEDEEDIDRKDKEQKTREIKLSKITRKIQTRISQRKWIGVPRPAVTTGLFSMMLLFCGVMVGLGIVEYGAVYSNGCTYNWWFHLWYLCGMLSLSSDSIIQLTEGRQ